MFSLRTYSDSIGITYYLVEQLRTAFKPSEVEFYWAQLCHLLISKPSKSRALEYFVLQRCDESVHVALLVSRQGCTMLCLPNIKLDKTYNTRLRKMLMALTAFHRLFGIFKRRSSTSPQTRAQIPSKSASVSSTNVNACFMMIRWRIQTLSHPIAAPISPSVRSSVASAFEPEQKRAKKFCHQMYFHALSVSAQSWQAFQGCRVSPASPARWP